MGGLTPGTYGSDKVLLSLVAKIHRNVWHECWATAERKARTLISKISSVLLLELAQEKESDQHLNADRSGGGHSGNHGRCYQRPRPSGQGQRLKNARYMSNVRHRFWCDSRDENGALLVHAPHCDMHECFVVPGKKQDTKTGRQPRCPTTIGVPSPVPSLVAVSTTRMSVVTSSAYLLS